MNTGTHDQWTISQLAERVGVPLDTVRYYLKRELLREPARTAHGHRRFGPDDEARLRMIVQGKALGLTLRELKALAGMYDDEWLTCADVREFLRTKRTRLEQQAAQLREQLDRIDTLVARCDCTGRCGPEGIDTVLDPECCADESGACAPDQPGTPTKGGSP